ncbi:unnamed protein product [Gongylonema pulchrum]|uniref:CID domain-containing protein n=1 Tax=Gongylonema pulchrum TaxID=637853 RepID=A0A183E466_9BILA|nr:unnamed protein product [Gongylonema pulchrum]
MCVRKQGRKAIHMCFCKHLRHTGGSENVQKAVSRILDIFEERQIYSKSQLADMRAAQSDSNEMEDNSLLDFDTGCLIRDIEGYHKGNLVMERARELLSRSDFNFRDKIKSRMKEIERAKRSFALQLRDATVVEDAYQKFGAGIDEVRAEVEEMLKSGFYPGASPPRDAPSPTANDDPFSEGVETAFKRNFSHMQPL